MEFADLAKYGIGGIALAILGFAYFIFKSYNKIVANHIAHSTEAMNKNSDAINGLSEAIRDLKEEIRSR